MIAKLLARIPTPPLLFKALEILKILQHDVARCDMAKHASAMAYVTLFSLVPSLAAIFALISLFKPFLGPESKMLLQAKTFILQNLATGSGEQLISFLDQFISNLDMTRIGLTGFAGLLFTLVLLLRQIEEAMNRIWLVKRPRHIVTRFVYFWTFLTLGTLIVGLTIGILSGFNLKGLNPLNAETLSMGQHMVHAVTPFLAVLLFFTLLYKIVPNTQVNLKFAFFGALPAAIIFNIAAASYGWFAPNFMSYKAVYGALAAVPLFLMWLYILWFITLFGALLAWRFEQSFNLKEDLDDASKYLNVAERIRNHQLQGMLPYVCALAVHHVYKDGEGNGLKGYDLCHHLNLPSPWVSEALDFLVSAKLIIAAQDDTETNDMMSRRFFPTHPSEKLTDRNIIDAVFGGTEAWVQDWKHEWNADMQAAMKQVLKNFKPATDRSLKATLESIVKAP